MSAASKERIRLLALESCIMLISLIILVPLLIMLLGSLKDNVEVLKFDISLPSKFRFDNYLFVIKSGNVLRAMSNSLLISFFSVLACLLFSSQCAFVLARRSTRKSQRIYNYFVLGMVAPLQIITTFALVKLLNLTGTYISVILIYIAVNLPFSVFMFTSFIKGVPRDIDEAAVVDGCSPLRLFYGIIFPNLKPVVATNIVIIAMSIWNDFMIPLYFLNSSSKWTMPLTVYSFFGQYFSDWNYVFADLMLTAMPIIILYLFCQKYIVAGMTAGAVKG